MHCFADSWQLDHTETKITTLAGRRQSVRSSIRADSWGDRYARSHDVIDLIFAYNTVPTFGTFTTPREIANARHPEQGKLQLDGNGLLVASPPGRGGQRRFAFCSSWPHRSRRRGLEKRSRPCISWQVTQASWLRPSVTTTVMRPPQFAGVTAMISRQAETPTFHSVTLLPWKDQSRRPGAILHALSLRDLSVTCWVHQVAGQPRRAARQVR